jgi:catechol 2,3-dioxygenase
MTGTSAPTVASIDAGTSLGAVALTVSDLDRSRAFYGRVLGLSASPRADGSLVLSAAAAGPALLTLHEDRDAAPFDPRGAGLFHFALLVPTRADLATVLARIAGARWPLSGASDHLVSEALYLRDPDGNGIEIYRDRPRAEWARDQRGEIQMATLALDLDDLIVELDRAGGSPGGFRESPLAAGTRIGHIHLQVSDLGPAEQFYCGVLGFDVTVRTYPGALFTSAGGYHHHIGLNTWQSRGAARSVPGGVGLRSFTVCLPDAVALESVLQSVRAAGLEVVPLEDDGAGEDRTRSDSAGPAPALVRDPFGIAVVLRCA